MLTFTCLQPSPMNQFTPQPDSALICTVQVCPSIPIISSDSPGGHYSLILSVITITRYLISFYSVVLTIVTFLVTTPVALFGGSNCASAGGILCDIIFSWKLANERDQRNFRITILGAVSQGDSSIWRILGEHHDLSRPPFPLYELCGTWVTECNSIPHTHEHRS